MNDKEIINQIPQQTNLNFKFIETMIEVQKIVDDIELIDLADIEKVKESHKILSKIRTSIQNQEKVMVAEANAFKTTVFDKRKDLLAITVPVESKFKTIIDEDDQKKIIEARKELLPMKMQQLSLLKTLLPNESEVLEMSEETWVVYYKTKVEEHDRQVAFEEVQAKKEAEELAEKNRLAEIEKENEKNRAEKAQAEEKQKLESDKKFQDFLSNNSFDKNTDILKEESGEVIIYRLVAKYKK